jgi:predicted enzyme related to lactoylglutathione lyase
MLYAQDTEKVKAFFRDVLELPFVDAGRGWQIFALPPAELASHPAEENRHEIYLMCEDVAATVEKMKAKGVVFTMEIKDQGWGLVTQFELPGGGRMGLYQPRHPSPLA